MQSEFDLFAFFEMTPDLVCIAGKDGFFRQINQAVINKLKYAKEELFSRPIADFIHPDDREFTVQRRSNLLEGNALVNFENRYVTSDNQVVWLAWTSVYIPANEVVFAIAKDITQKKLAEEAIVAKYQKFRGLASHFKKSIENERKYLANELHEELAQLATVIRIDLDWMNIHLKEVPVLAKNRIEHALGITDLLIETIKRISFAVSPKMLDDLGLSATLEWHCKEFALLNGIPCHFYSAIDESRLSKVVKLDIFRICQESLSDIMLQALANSVEVTIEDADEYLELSIVDDGMGFNVDSRFRSPGMNTRLKLVDSLNGKLNIVRDPEAGTTVNVIIPVEAD